MHDGIEAREIRWRSKIITVGEVYDILNAFNVPANRRAALMLIRQARHKRTFKYVLNRVWAYTKAFLPALIFTVGQKMNIKGRYSKGGVTHGRKDM